MQPETGGKYEPLGAGELLDHDDTSLRLRAGSTTVEVAALAPDLFRVGMFPAGGPPKYDSEAIAREDWDPIEVSMQESDEELTLSTTAATAQISLNPVRIGFSDGSGREFAVDDPELGMGAVETAGADIFSEPLGSPVRLYKRREAGENGIPPGLLQRGPAARSHRLLQQPLQLHPIHLLARRRQGPRALLRQHAQGRVRPRARERGPRILRGRGWRDRLLRLLRSDPGRRRGPLHRAHGSYPHAAAVVSGQPAMP